MQMKPIEIHGESFRAVGWRREVQVLAGVSLALALLLLGLSQALPSLSHHLASLLSSKGHIENEPRLNAVAAQHADLVEACSVEFRRRNAQEVDDGRVPALIEWECEGVPKCPGHAVNYMLDSYRQRQEFSFLQLVPCDFYRLIQGRAIWIVGDSIAQYFYRQLRCFLSPFLEKVPAGQEPRRDAYITEDPAEKKLIKERILQHYDGGVDIPICTHYVGSTRICHIRVNWANHFVDAYLPNLGLLNISRRDIVLFNMGMWHHPRETGHGEGNYGEQIQRIADYIAANRSRLPTMLWRDNSPQHFDIEHGVFPHPEDSPKLLPWPWKCVPLPDIMLLHDGTLWGRNDHIKRGGWRNIITAPIMAAAGIPSLITWNESAPLWELHTETECTHWCGPGAHSIWIWKLWDLLRGMPLPAGAGAPQRAQHGKHVTR